MAHIFQREDKKANSGARKIIIENCYRDCPYATDKRHAFNCHFMFRCSLLDRDIIFDDNLIHFSTLEDCPLDKNDAQP